MLVKEEGLKQKDWQGYPDVLMKAEISLRTRGLMGGSRTAYRGCIRAAGDWFGKVQLLRSGDDYVQGRIGNDSAHVRCHRTSSTAAFRRISLRADACPFGDRPEVRMGYPETCMELAYRSSLKRYEVSCQMPPLKGNGHLYLMSAFNCTWPVKLEYTWCPSAPGQKPYAQGRAFVDWAKGLPDDSAELHIGDMELDGTVSRSIWGDPGRWYCLCELVCIDRLFVPISIADEEIYSVLQRA